MKSSPPRSTFGTMTGLMSFKVRPPVARIAVRVAVERSHRGIARRHALALEIGDADDAAVLAGEEAHAQHIDRADDAQVVLQLAGLDAFDHLQHVGHAEVDLAVRHHRDQHRLAGGGLNQRVHAALFLQRLGDRRGHGVGQACRAAWWQARRSAPRRPARRERPTPSLRPAIQIEMPLATLMIRVPLLPASPSAARLSPSGWPSILLLEVFQRARMVWHAVLLVAELPGELAQHRLHRDQLVLVSSPSGQGLCRSRSSVTLAEVISTLSKL